jgi:hypothetical protein
LFFRPAPPRALADFVSIRRRSAPPARPAVGAWSPREVLAQLLHAETLAMGPRVKRASETDNVRFETPAEPGPPPGTAREMSNAWADARSANLVWLRQLSAEQRRHVAHHYRFGEITVETYVAEWAYHDLDHLRQILSVLAADLYPHIGPFQQLYAAPACSPRGAWGQVLSHFRQGQLPLEPDPAGTSTPRGEDRLRYPARSCSVKGRTG